MPTIKRLARPRAFPLPGLEVDHAPGSTAPHLAPGPKGDATMSDLHRREFLGGAAALAGAAVLGGRAGRGEAARKEEKSETRGKPTKFILACMTLPYSQFPLERALTGIKSAG